MEEIKRILKTLLDCPAVASKESNEFKKINERKEKIYEKTKICSANGNHDDGYCISSK